MADDHPLATATPREASPARAPAPVPVQAPVQTPAPVEASAPAGVAAWTALLEPEQKDALETLAKNLARATATTQAAIAVAAPAQAQSAQTDPFHVQPALTEVAARLAAEPARLVRAQTELFERYLDLWSTMSRRAQGEPAPAAKAGVEASKPGAKPDKRFKDPEWTENPVFDVMRQSYLITSDFLNSLAGGVEGVDPMTKRRVEFFTKMLTDTFSPSNFLMTNPAALREAAATQGASLVRGAEQFAADLARGGGHLSISQTDYSKFKVGENVATAPGKVVFQNELFQLLQFSPTTQTVFETPLLIFPPWINKYYILDLRPENSMIRWLTAQGFTVFVTSWVNPEPELAGKTLENYMREGAYTALEQVLVQTGAAQANTVGYCIGGTLLACTLAHMAARGVQGIASATFFAAQQDFAEAGDLLLFTSEAWLADLNKQMDAAGGVLPGQIDGRHLQLPARQRPDLVVLREQLSDGQGACGLRPPVLEQRPDADAQGPAHELPRRLLPLQQAVQGRADPRRPSARPGRRHRARLRAIVAGGPHRAHALGLPRRAAVRGADDLHPGRLGPYRRRDQRPRSQQIPALGEPRAAADGRGVARGGG